MNYYIVVEGKSGEREVYPKWIPQIASCLVQVSYLNEINHNNFYLISGDGYPYYYRIIDSAIEDMKDYPIIDKLVIAVDAEDYSYEEKLGQINDHIQGKIALDKVDIIIQYPCLETWALGNRIVFRRYPQDLQLRKYLRLFDVRILDPERLPALEEDLNRCQFAFKYLKRILTDRYPRLTYSKAKPTAIMHEKYFDQIRKRYLQTRHIGSFSRLLDTFSSR